MLNGYAANFYEIVFPVLLLSSAIVGYALIVGASYKTMAKRDIFTFKKIKEARKEYRGNPVMSLFIALFEYSVVFPLIVIVWFTLLSILLFILSQELTVESLLTVSIAMVASTRILSCFNEEIAVDIAKLFTPRLLS